MKNDYVAGYGFTMDRVFDLFKKFLSICNEDVWREKFGGWPVAEQFYHAVDSTAFFCETISGKKPVNPCPEAGHLEKPSGKIASKEQAGQYLADVQKCVENIIAACQNEDLLKKNDQLSKLFGSDVNNGTILELMCGHMLYHLGSCDAALRNRGLEGAF